MLEDLLGEVRWAVAIIVIAVVAGVTWFSVNQDDNQAEVKREAVVSCSAQVEETGGSLAECVENVMKELDS